MHDLRHSAASRMARDSELSLTDVQWVMGHAHLITTEIYLTPTQDEVIEGVLAHHDVFTFQWGPCSRLGLTFWLGCC